MRQPLISRDAALFAAVFLLGNAANAPTPAIPDDPVKIGDLGKGLSRDHLPVTRAARSWFSHAKESRAGSRTSIKHSVGHDKDGTTTVFEETTFTSAPRCFVASEDGNVLHFAVATGSVDTVWRVDADGNFQVIGGEAISVQAMASAGDDAVLLLGTHLDELQAYLIAAGKDAYSPVGEAVEWTSSAAPTHLAVSASGFAFDWRSNSSRKLHRVTVWGENDVDLPHNLSLLTEFGGSYYSVQAASPQALYATDSSSSEAVTLGGEPMTHCGLTARTMHLAAFATAMRMPHRVASVVGETAYEMEFDPSVETRELRSLAGGDDVWAIASDGETWIWKWDGMKFSKVGDKCEADARLLAEIDGGTVHVQNDSDIVRTMKDGSIDSTNLPADAGRIEYLWVDNSTVYVVARDSGSDFRFYRW
jgi:hypothetical protein